MQYLGTKVVFPTHVTMQHELAKFLNVIMTGPSECTPEEVSMRIQKVDHRGNLPFHSERYVNSAFQSDYFDLTSDE